MGVLHLVRHGQASFGAADYDVLSELGKRQAERAGAALRERGLTEPGLLGSGALSRQQDTVRLCVAAAGYRGECEVDPRWDEYDHDAIFAAYGGPDGAGQTKHTGALVAALHRWHDDGDTARCAESWTAFRARISAALADALDRAADGGAVIATSGGVIAAVCADLLALPMAGYVAMNLAGVNTGITTVARGSRGPMLLSFNEHAHVLGEHKELLSYL